MRKICNFLKILRTPQNLALIIAIASGVGWVWQQYRGQQPVKPPTPSIAAPLTPPITTGNVIQNATSNGSGDAINAAPGATVINNKVNSGE